ncbi:MAG: hypothetical protein WBC05_23735 [Sedimentisphaerales bacterium]
MWKRMLCETPSEGTRFCELIRWYMQPDTSDTSYPWAVATVHLIELIDKLQPLIPKPPE